MRTFIILLMLCNISFAFNQEQLLNKYIRDDIIKFLYINFHITTPYVAYEIFDEVNIRKYLNCFIISNIHNKNETINIDFVNINIYDGFIGTKNVSVIGYVLLDEERIDVNFDVMMKLNGMEHRQGYKIDPSTFRYKIVYITDNHNKEYCLIK